MNKKTLQMALFAFLCTTKTITNHADAKVSNKVSEYGHKAWDGTKSAAKYVGDGVKKAGHWMYEKFHNLRHKS